MIASQEEYEHDRNFARRYGITVAKVRECGAFADAVDAIAAAEGPQVKELILSGKSGMTKLQIILKGEMVRGDEP